MNVDNPQQTEQKRVALALPYFLESLLPLRLFCPQVTVMPQITYSSTTSSTTREKAWVRFHSTLSPHSTRMVAPLVLNVSNTSIVWWRDDHIYRVSHFLRSISLPCYRYHHPYWFINKLTHSLRRLEVNHYFTVPRSTALPLRTFSNNTLLTQLRDKYEQFWLRYIDLYDLLEQHLRSFNESKTDG